MLSFAGKRVLVTGASKGIGQACAARLLELGAHVVALGRDERGLAELQGSVTPVVADASDAAGLRAALEREAGDVDLLVNNAGVARNAPILDASADDWDATFAVNARAALIAAQHCAKSMIARDVRGAIVNVSSQAAFVALDEHAAYCASKAALDALTRQLALELGPFGIRANSVNPTVTLTEMAAREWGDEAKAAPMKSRIPLGEFAAPDDVVDAVCYLLGDGARLVSGAALPIDGGFVAAPFNNAMAPGYDRSARTGRRTLMTAAPFSGGEKLPPCPTTRLHSHKEGNKEMPVLGLGTFTARGKDPAAQVRPALEKSLLDLGVDKVDLFLMHWPTAFVHVPMIAEDAATGRGFAAEYEPDLCSKQTGKLWDETHWAKTGRWPPHLARGISIHDTYAAMLACRDAGLCDHVGVANFNVMLLHELCCVNEAPAVVQCESHPFLQQRNLICLRWTYQRGVCTMPMTIKEREMRENLSIFHFELDDEDNAAIAALELRHHYLRPEDCGAWAFLSPRTAPVAPHRVSTPAHARAEQLRRATALRGLATREQERVYLPERAAEPLLSLDEEVALATEVQALVALRAKRSELKAALGREPSGGEWANATGYANYGALRTRMGHMKACREELIQRNLRLVLSVAKRYGDCGLAFTDLCQEGNFGLAKACDRFDPSKGFRFSTYAVWWIRQAVAHAVAHQSRTIRLPTHAHEKLRRMKKHKVALEKQTGRDATDDEIAREMSLDADKLRRLRRAARGTVSTDVDAENLGSRRGAAPGNGRRGASYASGAQLADLLHDATQHPERDAAESLLKDEVRRMLDDDLEDREEDVLNRHFGLDGRRPETLAEIAVRFDLTRERIRQIEKSAFAKLRQPHRSRRLAPHYDELYAGGRRAREDADPATPAPAAAPTSAPARPSSRHSGGGPSSRR
ncbi:sigma-70 [Aureococcus anophagefferens]|nr:sigma-70 [Aureococcus anophagefferens]